MARQSQDIFFKDRRDDATRARYPLTSRLHLFSEFADSGSMTAFLNSDR
jgi:hypothetical protein